MNKKNIFSLYNHRSILLTQYSLKILKFKSLKWRKLKEFLKKKQNRKKKKWKYLKKKIYIIKKKKKKIKFRIRTNSFIINPLIIKINYYKIKLKYKLLWDKNLITKTLLLYYNHRKINIKKKYFSKLANIKFFLLKPLYNLSILLWNYNFSFSIKNSKKLITRKAFYINNIKNSKQKVLTKGFFIYINYCFTKKTNKIKYIKNNNIYLFTEVDYYINSLITLKNYKNFKLNDYYLSVSNLFKVNKLFYY